LIEKQKTNPEKTLYEIINGYSLLFMAKAPRHDAQVIPFKHDKMSVQFNKYNMTKYCIISKHARKTM